MSTRVAIHSPVNYSSMSTGYKYRTRPGHDTTSTKSTRLGRETGSAGRYRSPSTGRTSDISSHVGTGSYGTGRSSRPLPAGPGGPYDINGRRISTYEAISTLPRKTKGTSGIGSSTYSSSYSRPSLGSQRSTSLSRDHYMPTGRKSSVSELRNKFETTSLNDTSSSSLKRGKKSTSLYDVNKNVFTPEKYDKHEKYERETVDSLLHDKSSNTSTPIKSTYSSSYSPRHYETDQKLPDINKTLRSRSNSREKVKEESLLDKHSHRKDSNTSSIVGGYTHSTSSHGSNTSNSTVEVKGLTGLKNLGNTCFMNSILQCLSNTKPLWDYIHKDRYKTDINKSTSSMKGALITEYANLMRSLWKDSGDRYSDKYISPTVFKAQIQKFAPRFVGYNQQDAQEFLIYLLEGLHEDVNKVIIKKKRQVYNEEEDDKISPRSKPGIYWNRYLNHDNSKMVDIFVGQLRSCLKCTVCDYESLTYDPFWDLSLPVPKRYSKGTRLEDCFQNFTQEEVLDGDERPNCAKCKKRQKCTKRFTIQRFPNILVLHLKRFNQERFTRSKLETQVEFPMNNLDLTKYSADSGAMAVYDLYGVANHSGSTSYGHYTAHCKHPFTKEWHYFNDQRVSSCNSTRSIGSNEAYVLFYELTSQSARL